MDILDFPQTFGSAWLPAARQLTAGFYQGRGG